MCAKRTCALVCLCVWSRLRTAQSGTQTFTKALSCDAAESVRDMVCHKVYCGAIKDISTCVNECFAKSCAVEMSERASALHTPKTLMVVDGVGFQHNAQRCTYGDVLRHMIDERTHSLFVDVCVKSRLRSVLSCARVLGVCQHTKQHYVLKSVRCEGTDERVLCCASMPSNGPVRW